MKNKTILALALVGALTSSWTSAFAQGTSFTYQGRLNDGADLADGNYDLRFAIFDALTVGTRRGNLLTNSATDVSNGLFTVTLDFGNQFPGANRWLEISVRTNGAQTFFTLSPRQTLTPAPYAITAGNVISGGLDAGAYGNAVTFNNANSSFSGSFNGNGANVTNVNAATLAGLSAANFWKTGGNAGTSPGVNFLGATDNQPLELRVNNQRALRLEPNTNGAPNVIGGSSINHVDAGIVGATIAGGGAASYSFVIGSATNLIQADFGVIGGGLDNLVFPGAKYATIAGGVYNIVSNHSATVGGGYDNRATGQGSVVCGGGSLLDSGEDTGNTASATLSFVGGGGDNTSAAYASVIGGGSGSTISTTGSFSVIGGGDDNQINGMYATIPGGFVNVANGAYSFAAGHSAQALHQGAFVWADSQAAAFASTANDQFLIRAQGGVGIGTSAPETPLHIAGVNGITIGQSATGGGYTALRLDLSAAQNGYAELQAIKQSGTSYGDLVLETVGGNVGISTTAPSEKLTVNGNILAGGTITGSSDRNVKEHFLPVSVRDVLEKVSALPITEWNYKADKNTLRHIGPMAQDFHAAFNVGMDDKHISMVDGDGVALAAIQGLNQELKEEISAKDAKIQSLELRLARLENLVATIAATEKMNQ